MKENEGINGLFRNRLGQSEMPVRKDFWEELQRDLTVEESGGGRRLWLSPSASRIAMAASVALVLGVASAAYWFLASPDVKEQAFTSTAAFIPETVWEGDRMEESLPAIRQVKPVSASSVQGGHLGNVMAQTTSNSESQTMSVHFSITVSQQVYGERREQKHPSGYVRAGSDGTSAVRGAYNGDESISDRKNSEKTSPASPLKSRNWAIKPYIGTALPKGDCRMPFTAGVQVERWLNRSLALEVGLQYNVLHNASPRGAGRTLHTLAVPVKLDVLLAGNDKVDFYATAGGSVEKCVAGAVDNSFSAEPVQLSVLAGLGVRYKLTDRIALFAEPTVSHYFDTDSSTRSLRTERPTNLNLLCGVRMLF